MKFSSQNLIAYAQLMRLDRPIGIYLVLWPTLWALWLAAEGVPSTKNLVIFVLGVVLMRTAGCVINDVADRDIDGKVARTKNRPLVSGMVSTRAALILFTVLVVLAFILVLFTNRLTILLAFGALILASAYPFMKRYTHLPQVVLGAAFAWSVPMAFAAESKSLEPVIWLVYSAVLIWTVAYDTFYAMVDRDDDIKAGIKSTAVLFADQDRVITGALQFITVFALALVGQRFELGMIYSLSILVATGLFVYQQHLIKDRDRAACFKAFTNNHYVGLVIFLGIALDYAFIGKI